MVVLFGGSGRHPGVPQGLSDPTSGLSSRHSADGTVPESYRLFGASARRRAGGETPQSPAVGQSRGCDRTPEVLLS
jgi:hypothetical protein